MSEAEIRRELSEVEAKLAAATSAVARLEGWRERLVARLLDLEGADSSRPVAVR